MPTGAIYARFSHHNQEGGASIDVQVRHCREMLAAQAYTVPEPYVFVDRARSGTKEAGRESYLRMFEKARAGKFSVISVYKFDRLARNFLESVKAIAELQKLGVEVWSATEGRDPLVRNILLAVAEEYSRQLGGRVWDAKRELAAAGFRLGGRIPYGYRRTHVEDTRHGSRRVRLDPDPVTAPVVERIFREFAEGVGQNTIRARLNLDGIPAPIAHGWRVDTIRKLLANPVYVGVLRWNFRDSHGKHHSPQDWLTVKGAHPAIVDAQTWTRVQDRFREIERQGRGKGGANGNGETRLRITPHILSGLVFCGVCGSRAKLCRSRPSRPIVSLGKRKDYHHYRCSVAVRAGSTGCSNRRGVPQAVLEGGVIEALRLALSAPDIPSRLARALQEREKAASRGAGSVDARLRRVEAEIARLVEGVRSVGVSPALAEALKRAEARRDELLRERSLFHPPETPPLSPPEIEREVSALAGILSESDPYQVRMALASQVERVSILPDGSHHLIPRPGSYLTLLL